MPKVRRVHPTVPTVGQLLEQLRSRGWMVAVHNDYKLSNRRHTFWLFTKGPFSAKGEGFDDIIALKAVNQEVDIIEEFRDQMRLGHWEGAARVYLSNGWGKLG